MSALPLGLTQREADVVAGLIEHGLAKVVADKLFLSQSTVEGYLARARERTGIRTSLQLCIQFDRAARTAV